MNRWIPLALITGLVLGFAAGRADRLPRASAFDPERDLTPARLTDLLGLSSAQAAQIESALQPFSQAVRDACDAHCAARCNLVRYLGGDTFDPANARRMVDAMCDAHRANELASIDQIAVIRGVLTADQRSIFLRGISQCLCETCASGDEMCCAPGAESMPQAH